MTELWPRNVEYKDRQVYAAIAKVPVEICLKCPFCFEVRGGNMHGQPGVCCQGREEKNYHNMTGTPLCF